MSASDKIVETIKATLTFLKNRIDTKANDADVVKLSGTQTIAGTKTFSSTPRIETAAVTTNSTYAASTAFVNNLIDAKVVKFDSAQELTNDQKTQARANIDSASSGHTHTTSLASDSGTASITLAHGSTYKLTAGGTNVIFTMPTDNNTTYSSKTEASGGTDVSLVTTGEKYTWNNKSDLAIGTTATTAAAGNHTHSITNISVKNYNDLNMNEQKESGYGYGYNMTNAAISGISNFLILNYSNDWGTQVQFPTGDAPYIRYWQDAGGVMKSWKQLAWKDHTHSEYASTSHTHSYLPLSGGTLTGPVTFEAADWQTANASGIKLDTYGNWQFKGANTCTWQLTNQSGTICFQILASGGCKAPSFQATSDIRKKSDINPVNNLDLSNIKAYNYILKDDNKRHIGLIAQEIEKIIPDAVFEDKDGFKSLDYNAMVAVLVDKINRLEAKISTLESKQ